MIQPLSFGGYETDGNLKVFVLFHFRDYPFTDPAVIPEIICFCNAR